MHLERKTIENDEDYLRQISKPVDFKTEEYKDAIKELDYFCKNDDNVMAMASVQVGIPLRLIYLKKTDLNRLEDDYNEERVLINPKIIKEEGLTRYWEACASCLNYTGLVERPYKIEVEYYDIEGKKHREIFEGFESTVLSHEIDHLNGILHIDIALKIRELTKEERKELRKKEPYQIIQKDGEYTPTKQRISPKTPKIEKRIPNVLSTKEVELLLEQPTDTDLKGIRDKAMLEFADLEYDDFDKKELE